MWTGSSHWGGGGGGGRKPETGIIYPKMDGENNGKPENPIKMDDLGVYHYFWKHPYRHVVKLDSTNLKSQAYSHTS